MKDDEAKAIRSQVGAIPSDRHLQVAETGGVPERFNLASTYELDPAAARLLLQDEDVRVLRALAGNYGVEPSVLASLAEKGPELSLIVSRNPFAPIELREALPLSEHAALSISRFLDERAATSEQRALLARRYEVALRTGDVSVTLGQAWREALE